MAKKIRIEDLYSPEDLKRYYKMKADPKRATPLVAIEAHTRSYMYPN